MNPGSGSEMKAIAALGHRPLPEVNFDRDVYCLLGLPFDAVNMADAIRVVRNAAAQRTACFVSTPNLNFLIGCLSDRAFRESVINSDLSIADGMPLIWIARLLDIPIPERVPGSGLFEALRRDISQPLSVYLLGGPDGVAETACRRLNSGPSGVRCAGFESPGFGSIEDMSRDATIAAINASRADFLLISLGARKGQAWIERNRARITVPVISHLGAVVNFVAGTLKRAPLWMQRGGLEWLWRVKEEPGLWRRYLADGLAFTRLVATRVIPHWRLIRLHAYAKPALDTATFGIRKEAGEVIVGLRGAWTRKNLGPLREWLSRGVIGDADLRLDLEHVTYVDASFLGLMLLLHGHQKGHGRSLSFSPLSRQARKIFALGCCEFLLDGGPP